MSGRVALARTAARLTLLAFLCAVPRLALSQAWTPQKGSGSAGLTYEFVEARGHYGSDGKRDPIYGARTQAAVFEFEYGFTDRLAIDFRLPYIASRYTDRTPPNTPEDLRRLFNEVLQQVKPGETIRFLDDGSYNATLQDLRTTLRYKLLDRSFVLTPFFSLTVPTHHYQSIGESSPGRDLREFQFGANVARSLDPIAPQAYVHAQYGYSVVQRFLGFSTDHSDAHLTLGYFLTPELSARAIGSWGQVHGGLPFEEAIKTPERNLQHEKLLKGQYWHIGGGVNYSLSPKIDLHATIFNFLSGKDTHFGTGLVVGISRSFSRAPRK